MVNVCMAPNCKVKSGQKEKIPFFTFPKDETICKAWCEAIGRKDFTPTKNSRLCAKHFRNGDFEPYFWGNPKLKKGSVPSIFDFSDSSQESIAAKILGNEQEIKREQPESNSSVSASEQDGGCSSTVVTYNFKSSFKNSSELGSGCSSAVVASNFKSSPENSSELDGGCSLAFVASNFKSVPSEQDGGCSSTAYGFNLPPAMPGGTIKHPPKSFHKTKVKRKSYVGDFKETDLSTPELAEKFLDVTQKKLDDKLKVIADLRRKNRLLSQKYQEMKTLICALQGNRSLKGKGLTGKGPRNPKQKKSAGSSKSQTVSPVIITPIGIGSTQAIPLVQGKIPSDQPKPDTQEDDIVIKSESIVEIEKIKEELDEENPTSEHSAADLDYAKRLLKTRIKSEPFFNSGLELEGHVSGSLESAKQLVIKAEPLSDSESDGYEQGTDEEQILGIPVQDLLALSGTDSDDSCDQFSDSDSDRSISETEPNPSIMVQAVLLDDPAAVTQNNESTSIQQRLLPSTSVSISENREEGELDAFGESSVAKRLKRMN